MFEGGKRGGGHALVDIQRQHIMRLPMLPVCPEVDCDELSLRFLSKRYSMANARSPASGTVRVGYR